MIATITLNPSIDQHILVRGLVKDDANRAESILRYAGGKGLNVSKVVRELGGPTRAYAIAGGIVGRFWQSLVRELDIRHVVHPTAGNTRINTILTDLEDHTQTRVSAPGPTVRAGEVERFLARLTAVRPRPFLWVLGGSLSKGMPAATYERMVTRLQAAGTPCVLDADDEPLRLGLRARPFAIKPNEYEMQRLVGRKLRSTGDYLAAARRLAGQGIRVVIVSLGASGALFVTAEKAWQVPGLKVPVRSKVGAGDSLIGGFTHALWKKRPLEEAARWAIAASSSAVMREAPRLCRRSDVTSLYRRTRIVEL